jgi:hypothetical protein
MRHELDAALDQCLAWMREGMDLKTCLDRYPEYAAELRPLLEVAVDVVRVRVPASPIEARADGQRRMLAVMAQKQERLARTHPATLLVKRIFASLLPGKPGSLRPAWQLAAVMLMVVLIAGGWMAVAASAGSLPGDVLYPVKLASQKAQLALMFNPAKQRLMADQFETQQRMDVQAALKGRRQVAVEFRGVLQEFDNSQWVVGGLPVMLQETTTIVGQPSLGAMVRVQADMPGDDKLVARRLSVESTIPDPTDTQQPTATLVPTRTPEPIETQESTRTPEASATLRATETAIPSDTPEPTDTPEPDDTSEPEETEEPEQSPEPDDTEESEETEEPEQSSEPDDTEEPEETDEPEQTPEPDDTTEPEDTPGGEQTPEPDDTDEPEQTGEPEQTPEPEDTAEPEGTPDQIDTPDPDETDEPGESASPTETPEPDNPDGHAGTPEPTEEPED